MCIRDRTSGAKCMFGIRTLLPKIRTIGIPETSIIKYEKVSCIT